MGGRERERKKKKRRGRGQIGVTGGTECVGQPVTLPCVVFATLIVPCEVVKSSPLVG